MPTTSPANASSARARSWAKKKCCERREVDRRERRLAGLADQPHLPARDVVGAGEIAAAAERPGHRRGVERERLLDLVHELERVAALAIHLVDEGEDRDVAQPADL